jgi:Natural resistance-associated macrophage protein
MAFEIEQPIDASPSPVVEPTKPRLLGVLGPGLITGASDDDPSGFATYSQAGAQFDYALTWTMLFTYPMTTVQIVSARMGRTTGRGIAGNLRTSSRFRSWSWRPRRCTPQHDRHPDLCPGSRSLAAHCRFASRINIRPWCHVARILLANAEFTNGRQ